MAAVQLPSDRKTQFRKRLHLLKTNMTSQPASPVTPPVQSLLVLEETSEGMETNAPISELAAGNNEESKTDRVEKSRKPINAGVQAQEQGENPTKQKKELLENASSTSEEHWDALFKKLVDFKSENGSCLVPQPDSDDTALSNWVFLQRIKGRDGLSKYKVDKLESIKFDWYPPTVTSKGSWNTMFEHLVKYREKHGDCLVPQRYVKYPKLGRWVNKQRENKDRLLAERIEDLEKIGFVWKVVQREPWESMFQRLLEFKRKYSDCLVPQRYKKDPRLGGWVREQRKRKEFLSVDRKRKLDSIGFTWKAKLERKPDNYLPPYPQDTPQQGLPYRHSVAPRRPAIGAGGAYGGPAIPPYLRPTAISSLENDPFTSSNAKYHSQIAQQQYEDDQLADYFLKRRAMRARERASMINSQRAIGLYGAALGCMMDADRPMDMLDAALMGSMSAPMAPKGIGSMRVSRGGVPGLTCSMGGYDFAPY